MKPQHLVLVTTTGSAVLCGVSALMLHGYLPTMLSATPRPVGTSVLLLLASAVGLTLTMTRLRWPSAMMGMGVAATALSILLSYWLDDNVAAVWVRNHVLLAGAPAPHALVSIGFLGAALLLVSTRRRAPTRVGHVLALVSMAVAMFVVVASVFGARELYGGTRYSGVSPLPGATAVLLNLGVLSVTPRFSLVRVFYTQTEGGRLARLFLPIVFGAPLVLAVIIASGLKYGWYTPEAAIALLAMCVVLVLGALTWRYALSVNSAEARLEQLVESRTRRLTETIAEVEEFSQALAHDVRGPLINLREFLDLIRSEHSPELSLEARDHLERAIRASKRIDALTQAMLRYGELSRRPFRIRPVELEPLVRAASDEMKSCHSPAAIVVERPLATVLADEAGLSEVLRELLANACRFATAGEPPRITISCHQHPATVRVLVRDEGIGVQPRFQERIFRPFEQLVPAPEHTGMGLALVRRAVTKMNGAVGVVSDGVNGSVFWIELPRPFHGGVETSPRIAT